jgi:hypothetical protein
LTPESLAKVVAKENNMETNRIIEIVIIKIKVTRKVVVTVEVKEKAWELK